MPSKKSTRSRRVRKSNGAKVVDPTKVLYVNTGPISNKVYKVLRWNVATTFTNSITVDTFFSQAITLDSIQGYTDFTSLYDQYRIMRVDTHLIPEFHVNTTTLTNLSVLWSCVDYDDDTVPASINEVQQFQNARVYANDGQTKIVSYKPHIAVAAYSGTFTSFTNMAAQWIDAASPSVKHYGLKLAMSTGSGATVTYYIVSQVWLEFRNTR